MRPAGWTRSYRLAGAADAAAAEASRLGSPYFSRMASWWLLYFSIFLLVDRSRRAVIMARPILNSDDHEIFAFGGNFCVGINTVTSLGRSFGDVSFPVFKTVRVEAEESFVPTPRPLAFFVYNAFVKVLSLRFL